MNIQKYLKLAIDPWRKKPRNFWWLSEQTIHTKEKGLEEGSLKLSAAVENIDFEHLEDFVGLFG